MIVLMSGWSQGNLGSLSINVLWCDVGMQPPCPASSSHSVTSVDKTLIALIRNTSDICMIQNFLYLSVGIVYSSDIFIIYTAMFAVTSWLFSSWYRA